LILAETKLLSRYIKPENFNVKCFLLRFTFLRVYIKLRYLQERIFESNRLVLRIDLVVFFSVDNFEELASPAFDVETKHGLGDARTFKSKLLQVHAVHHL
jgi:hypothetical protein